MDYFLDKYSTETVLEKYVGRKPELIQIEKELEKIVRRIQREVGTLNNFKGTTTANDLNRSDENARIEKLFKKLFGLKDFILNWLWSPLPDAHTMVKTFQLVDKNYGKRKDGSDFNSNLFVGVQISTGIVTTIKMDAGEILAIILHEIGHSFAKSIGQVLSRINPILIGMDEGSLAPVISSSGFISSLFFDAISINNIYTHAKRYGEGIKDAIKPLYKLLTLFTELFMYLGSMLPKTMSAAGYIKGITNPSRLIFLYGVEKHSDGFAVDYGYGKEMASALNKLDRNHEHPKMDIPVANWLYAFDDVIHEMLLEPLTGYPNLHNRPRSALDRLRKAAKDPDLDPKVRKELEEQIKGFEEYYDKYMSLQGNENKKYFFTWLYRQFVDKFFKGKMDIRELIYALDKDNPRNHGYYKEYLELEKKFKKK